LTNLDSVVVSVMDSLRDTPMTDDRTIFEIPEVNFPAFEKAIKKISKKSVRLTGEPVNFLVFGYHMKDVGQKEKIKVIEVLVTCEPVVVSGFQFIGTLDKVEDNILASAVPGQTIPENFWKNGATIECEHCGLNRRRNSTVVLRKTDDQTYKQVGKNCLKDFFGHDPKLEAAKAEIFASVTRLAGDCVEYCGGGLYVDLEHYLNYVAAAIRAIGWVSKKQAADTGQEPTCHVAYENAYPNGRTKVKEVFIPTEADGELVKKAIEWATSDAIANSDNDFLHNVYVVASAGGVKFKLLGIAAAIVSAYIREQERHAARKVEQADSKHIGTVGKRETFKGCKVLAERTIETNFGTSFLYKFANEENAILTWFSSRKIGLTVGEVITLVGSVKKHDSYQGIAQTVLTRCKVAE
jgi:hypothetical protein